MAVSGLQGIFFSFAMKRERKVWLNEAKLRKYSEFCKIMEKCRKYGESIKIF